MRAIIVGYIVLLVVGVAWVFWDGTIAYGLAVPVPLWER